MSQVLIVGGGFAGCTVAKELAAGGVRSTIIEAAERIGGKVRNYGCKATDKCNQCGVCLANGLWDGVVRNENINVLTDSKLIDLSGEKGDFTAAVKFEGGAEYISNISNVVVATGFADTVLENLNAFVEIEAGKDAGDKIILGNKLEKILKQRNETKLFEKEPKSVAFIQCYGSRDSRENAMYCSKVCCNYSTRAAKVIRQYYPDCSITFFYMELQMVNNGDYYKSLTDLGIEFIKCRPIKIKDGEITYDNLSTGKMEYRNFDLVVLSDGIRPPGSADRIAELCGFNQDESGFLKYVSDYKDARDSGIFLAGCVKSPLKIEETYADAMSAAKEIILSERHKATSPRANTNILILGNNEINSRLAESFSQEGFEAKIISNISDVARIRGSAAEFMISTADERFTVSSIIITEPKYIEDISVGEAKTFNVTDPDLIEQLDSKAKKTAKPDIVFLLDYLEESPEFLTAKALNEAYALAKRGCRVYFFSKFIRTSSAGMEQLYRQMRQAGITFIKYESAELNLCEKSGGFTVKVFDGVFETEVTTEYVISAGKGAFPNLQEITKKLRLTGFNHGQLNDEKYFLYPTLTGRKDVFYFNPSVSSAGFDAGLQSTIAALFENSRSIKRAVIDAGKCAFCYSCRRACPHAALEPDIESSAMKCVESACEGCGICVSICPGCAISVENEIGLSVEAINPGSANRCKFFCCENSAASAFRECLPKLGRKIMQLSVSEIPCGGRVSLEMITTALSTYGKVLIGVCNDDACRHISGGKRACKQIERTVELLHRAGVSEKQVKYIKVSHVMENVLKENIIEFLSGVKNSI